MQLSVFLNILSKIDMPDEFMVNFVFTCQTYHNLINCNCLECYIVVQMQIRTNLPSDAHLKRSISFSAKSDLYHRNIFDSVTC